MYLKIKKNKKECSIANSSMLRNVHTNFHPNPLKLIYNLVFWGQKTSFFFGTLKSILKIKNSKKGLSSSYLATIYYMHAKLQICTIISFGSGGGGARCLRVCPLITSTPVYIYIYMLL